jgi:hypothetical protein
MLWRVLAPRAENRWQTVEDSESIFNPPFLDTFASAYDFFAATGACRSMTLTTLPG